MLAETKLDSLQQRLDTCNYRLSILHFQSLSRTFNSRLGFVLNNRGEFHLNNCCWSFNVSSGPDTCNCHTAIRDPDDFMEDEMSYYSMRPAIPILPIINLRQDEYKHLSLVDADESKEDFYHFRVLDKENIYKWYEMYKAQRDALQFQIKVRQLEKENQIDATFNHETEEWHLTDCKRSVYWDHGPDTCHCRQAMMDPWKYLKRRYKFTDVKKFLEKMKLVDTPLRYEK